MVEKLERSTRRARERERERHLCVRCRQDIEVARASKRGHTMTHVGEILVGEMVDQELDALMMAFP